MPLSLRSWLLGLEHDDNDEDDDGDNNKALNPKSSSKEGGEEDDDTSTIPKKKKKKILLLDGGVSTHLEELLKLNNDGQTTDFPHRSLWSSSLLLSEEGRQLIQQGHEDWLVAGSDILTTVTYQCHFGTISHPYPPPPVVNDQEMIQLWTWAIQLARKAIQKYHYYDSQQKQQQTTTTNTTSTSRTKQIYLVASSGCYGAALADGSEFTGNYPGMTFDSLKLFHWKKAQVVWDHHLDGFAIETIPSVEECRAVCHMLRELKQQQQQQQQPVDTHIGGGGSGDGGDCCCWISLACRNGTDLNNGQPLADAIRVICEFDPTSEFVHAIGLNCCDSLHLPSLLQIITTHLAVHAKSIMATTATTTSDMADQKQGHRKRHRQRGIVIYPNSGEEWDAAQAAWKAHTGCASSYEFANRLWEAVQVVEQTWTKYHPPSSSSYPMPRLILGGCCRTSPTTIAALRKLVDERGGDDDAEP